MGSIAIITARSSSKGLPDKNIRELCGKPLLAYSIECAISSGRFDKVFVSTDSEKYAEIAERFGADPSLDRKRLRATRPVPGMLSGKWFTNLRRKVSFMMILCFCSRPPRYGLYRISEIASR